ncbi:Purine nucleoside phosphorylase [hydrothermal vent metagenome]|uniref:Purine nucleoside phosphorylase n=1 Tax=hydrothermal vent metagenome TaxID=652676 RepID=A0A1W1CKM2_9ZZZZ
MIICAGEIESFEFAKPMGIGMVDTAINLTKECIANPPYFLLFIGSAGTYGEHKIFDIVESTTASNIENSFFNAKSYTPIDNIVSMNDNVSHETMLKSSKNIMSDNNVSCETIVNSSNYITTDERVSEYYLSNNIGLENMEFYAVLKVAKAFNISARGVFIVTNRCDKNAHADFIKNHKEAMQRLTDYLKRHKKI